MYVSYNTFIIETAQELGDTNDDVGKEFYIAKITYYIHEMPMRDILHILLDRG